MMWIKQYIFNILIWLDQGLNVFAGGDPDETVSSRCGKRLIRSGKQCKFCFYLCKYLDKVDPRHCKDSIEWDEGLTEWEVRADLEAEQARTEQLKEADK